jgi:signal transduction histidine kinase
MLGHVRLLRKQASGEDLRQLSVVERSSSHLLRLIEDLLEYNHETLAPERLEPEWVTMEGFLASLQLIGSVVTADSGNQFIMQMSDELPATMLVDEVRLTQVLRILIDNACKFTRAGEVIFSLSCEEGEQGADDLARCRLRFSVKDNGRGIDAADVGYIFEPLYRGKIAADLPGLGLGLAIAVRWVERMGSTIVVESRRGLGSHFSFVLDLDASFDAVSPAREPQRKGDYVAQNPQDALRFFPLAQEEHHALGELIHMGRLGRLRDWAQNLAMRYPQHREVVAVIVELAANADLDGLELLQARWL